MVQMRIISSKASRDLVKDFEDRAHAMQQRILQKVAEVIVAVSPVDTGTYVLAHTARPSKTEFSTQSSANKRRGVNANQFRNLALGNLMRSVAALRPGNTEVFFRNRAEHAAEVEYLGWPPSHDNAYHVYGQARAAARGIIADAKQEFRFT